MSSGETSRLARFSVSPTSRLLATCHSPLGSPHSPLTLATPHWSRHSPLLLTRQRAPRLPLCREPSAPPARSPLRAPTPPQLPPAGAVPGGLPSATPQRSRRRRNSFPRARCADSMRRPPRARPAATRASFTNICLYTHIV